MKTHIFWWWGAGLFWLWKFIIRFECLFIDKFMDWSLFFLIAKIDFNLFAKKNCCVGVIILRRLLWAFYLSYGWTLRTKFLECFPGTSVCGPYFWAPLPCWALATHNDMMHIITNEIIINAKITAPKFQFIFVSITHFWGKNSRFYVKKFDFYPTALLVYPSCLSK